MGMVSAIRAAVGGAGSTSVESAQTAVAKAEEQLATEERRLAAAQAEIESATEAIASADPDADPKVFARQVQARDAARGRVEAVGVRRDRAQGALEKAQGVLEEAIQGARREDLAAIHAEIAARDEALTTEARSFAYRIDTERAALRALADRARRLDAELRAGTGETRPWRSRAAWLAAGGTAFQAADGVVRS